MKDENNKNSKTENLQNVKGSLTEQEVSQLPTRKRARVYMGPAPGFTHNPLLKLDRNIPCPCRSLKKFKKCCLPKLPQVVSIADAEKFREQMERPNLTFVTHENQALLRAAAEMKPYFEEQARIQRETDVEKN